MQVFDEFIAYQAESVDTVLISDLHLNPCEPAQLEQAFLVFLDKLLRLPNLKTLFILGDWFEVWLGDDVAKVQALNPYFAQMITKLQDLTNNGCQINIMHGNRDFLIGQKFCDSFGGKLVKEPFYLTLNGKKIRLEHGDALCTDDKKYQRFRKVIQNPVIKTLLLALPLQKREQIAHNLRQKSQTDNAKKSMQIMDVNEQAVLKALNNADILIHGHTHRPAVHQMDDKQRVVLGDWRVHDKNANAVIGIVSNKNIQTCCYTCLFQD